MANLREAKHWIGGEWSTAGTQRESIDPATGGVIGHYADGNAESAQAAIDAAQTAFETGQWRNDPFMRATALCRLADAYEARIGEIVETLATENAKMKYEAGFEAHFIARALRFAASSA